METDYTELYSNEVIPIAGSQSCMEVPQVDLPSFKDELLVTQQPPPAGYHSCFGLPYHDHNYGAPPPPTPPMSPVSLKADEERHRLERVVSYDKSQIYEFSEEPEEEVTITDNPKATANVLDAIESVVKKAVKDMDIEDKKKQIIKQLEEQHDWSASITRCICNMQHDDEYMICCDKCLVWQHADCMGIDRYNLPESYMCEKCLPRKVDRQRAIYLQTKKKDELIYDVNSDSETDSGDESKLYISDENNARPLQARVPSTINRHDSRENKEVPKKKLVRKKQKIKKRKFGENNEKVIGKEQRVAKNFRRKSTDTSFAQKWLDKHHQLPRRVKRLRNSIPQDENANDSWQEKREATPQPVEITCINQYSPEVKEMLNNMRKNGQHTDIDDDLKVIQLSMQLQAPVCRVGDVSKDQKGLFATESIRSHQLVSEFYGRILLQSEWEKEDPKNNITICMQPHMLFYSKFNNVVLAIDAGNYGNDARYVQRSCMPNSEIQHILESSQLHICIYSTRTISKESEITIPFDYNYRDCEYEVYCACNRVNGCPVAKFNRRFKPPPLPTPPVSVQRPLKVKLNNNATVKSSILDKRKRRKSGKSGRHASDNSRLQPHVELKREVKIDSRRDAKKVKARRKSSPGRMSVPVKTENPNVIKEKSDEKPVVKAEPKKKVKEEKSLSVDVSFGDGIDSLAPDVASPGVSDTHPDGRKKSREEKKMEAIMRAFAKMEKQEQRRKEAQEKITKEPKKDEDGSGDTKSGSDEDGKVGTNEATPSSAPPARSKVARGRRRNASSPARRRSILSSAASTESVNLSADESNSVVHPSVTMANSSGHSTPAASDQVFRFPKTKKHLMSEWLTERANEATTPLCIKTDHPEFVTASPTCYVRTAPRSPHNSCHFRRSSTSSRKAEIQPEVGSAKKRWLRQAMFEDNNPEDGAGCTSSECMSPAGQHSPCTSPSAADLVTPLKKRRLARESLDAGGITGSPESTPSPGNLPDGYTSTDSVQDDSAVLLSRSFHSSITPLGSSEHLDRLPVPGGSLFTKPGSEINRLPLHKRNLTATSWTRSENFGETVSTDTNTSAFAASEKLPSEQVNTIESRVKVEVTSVGQEEKINSAEFLGLKRDSVSENLMFSQSTVDVESEVNDEPVLDKNLVSVKIEDVKSEVTRNVESRSEGEISSTSGDEAVDTDPCTSMPDLTEWERRQQSEFSDQWAAVQNRTDFDNLFCRNSSNVKFSGLTENIGSNVDVSESAENKADADSESKLLPHSSEVLVCPREPTPPPVEKPKKKVSLVEYRMRAKKGGESNESTPTKLPSFLDKLKATSSGGSTLTQLSRLDSMSASESFRESLAQKTGIGETKLDSGLGLCGLTLDERLTSLQSLPAFQSLEEPKPVQRESLTARLRKEFGLSDEEEEKQEETVVNGEAGDGGDDDDDDDDIPPPPPPPITGHPHFHNGPPIPARGKQAGGVAAAQFAGLYAQLTTPLANGRLVNLAGMGQGVPTGTSVPVVPGKTPLLGISPSMAVGGRLTHPQSFQQGRAGGPASCAPPFMGARPVMQTLQQNAKLAQQLLQSSATQLLQSTTSVPPVRRSPLPVLRHSSSDGRLDNSQARSHRPKPFNRKQKYSSSKKYY